MVVLVIGALLLLLAAANILASRPSRPRQSWNTDQLHEPGEPRAHEDTTVDGASLYRGPSVDGAAAALDTTQHSERSNAEDAEAEGDVWPVLRTASLSLQNTNTADTHTADTHTADTHTPGIHTPGIHKAGSKDSHTQHTHTAGRQLGHASLPVSYTHLTLPTKA